MVNTPIQTMSSACQNKPKQKKRRLTIGRNPSVATCNSMTISQHRPRVTCSPWAPTKVKKADRKALRDGPAPMLSMWLNSLTSRPRNVAPKMKVIAIQTYVELRSPLCPASEPKPHVTLDASRQAVSISTCFLSNKALAVGPPALSPESTAYAAKSAANMMMSDSKNNQKP